MESNRFMLECTSICLETTWKKLESQRVYLLIYMWRFDVNITTVYTIHTLYTHTHYTHTIYTHYIHTHTIHTLYTHTIYTHTLYTHYIYTLYTHTHYTHYIHTVHTHIHVCTFIGSVVCLQELFMITIYGPGHGGPGPSNTQATSHIVTLYNIAL